MRIIAGKFKRHNIQMVASKLTRETSDKTRGAVFNSLGTKVIDASVLDLFAGSGAYGLEAISRGAKSVVFVDSQLAAIKTIEANTNKLRCDDQSTVIHDDYLRAIQTLKNQNSQFQIIILDPPYEMSFTSDVWSSLFSLLVEDGIIVYEIVKDKKVNLAETELRIYKELKHGIAKILFLEHK